ncbi:MAG: DUF4124 domain-containing protein [Proteobacteria bacterium]|nr:DUF4124 domain-containing protein [Pseudomonadota bacterium]NOG61005.1 DUF4124 domain-containing protein [Pseudomonadota bacterium]
MQLIISLLLVVFVGCLGAETVYKSVDEDGNIIFTDKPSEEAEEIKIEKLETIENPNPAKYKPSPKQAEESAFQYESLTVSSPENGAGIRSNNGNVSISLSLEPALQTGHKIIISMDGKEIGSGSSVSLQNVDRGTHSISASVIDGSGKKLISTSSSFSLLRATK